MISQETVFPFKQIISSKFKMRHLKIAVQLTEKRLIKIFTETGRRE